MAEAAPNVVNHLAGSPKVIRESLHGIGPISAANIIALRAEGKLCLQALENACTGVSKSQWKQSMISLYIGTMKMCISLYNDSSFYNS